MTTIALFLRQAAREAYCGKNQSQQLETMTEPTTRQLLEHTAQRAISYLENLDNRGVAPSIDAIAKLAILDQPLNEIQTPPEEVINLLDEVCSPATMAMAGPRFFGFVIGGALPVTLAANWLAGAWDQNSGLFTPTPATAQLEQVALKWLLDLFKLPPECGGAFVTGATMANFSALAAARHALLKRAGWNVEADGLFGAPAINVVVGDEAHPTLFKSLGLLGLGRNRVIKVPVDSEGKNASRRHSHAFRPNDCLCSGRQCEHGRVRSVS